MNRRTHTTTVGGKKVKRSNSLRMELPVAELLMRGRELIRYLRRYGELTWADWLEDRMEALRQNSVAGIVDLLDGFEGMGSLPDIYLCPEAGHRVTPRQEVAINEELLQLASGVYQLARDLGDFAQVDALTAKDRGDRRTHFQ